MKPVTIPDLVLNRVRPILYEGDLKHYFQVLCTKAQNVLNPYHNIRHMLHVAFMCFDALRYYRKIGKAIDLKEARELLMGALFHDFDHTGRVRGNDYLNIGFALRGVETHILPEDKPSLKPVKRIIKASQFPYKTERRLSLREQIMRDADLSQVFSDSWIRQIVFGLGVEMGLGPQAMLESQLKFLSTLEFRTEWGWNKFHHLKAPKIQETEDMLLCLQ